MRIRKIIMSIILAMAILIVPNTYVLATIATPMPINEIFADASIAQLVGESLGKEVTEIVTQTDLNSIKRLDAVNLGISDLSGVEHLKNLQFLDLNDNQISDVSSLSGLEKLATLRLNNNNLVDIAPLAGLVKIKNLNLGYNQISNLSPLEGLITLNSLSLGSNQIVDISSLSGLENLATLYLHTNLIDDISSMSTMTGLTYVDLGHNQIRDIFSLTELDNLTEVYLFDNKISDLPQFDSTQLQILDLRKNQIADVSGLSGLENIRSLDLGNNKIRDLNPLSALTTLTKLHLYKNQISDLRPLAALSGIVDLRLEEQSIVNPIMEWKTALNILNNIKNIDGSLIPPGSISDGGVYNYPNIQYNLSGFIDQVTFEFGESIEVNGISVLFSGVVTQPLDYVGYNAIFMSEGNIVHKLELVEPGSFLAEVPAPEREGYIFRGWNMEQDGSGMYWDFATHRMPSNDIVLYAQWVPVEDNGVDTLPDTGDTKYYVGFALMSLGVVILLLASRKKPEKME